MRRRSLVAGLALAPLAAGRARSATTLRMGDQRGNVRAMMQAAGVLDGLAYRLDWSEFAAAAPLAEAMNAGAVDGGVIGDAPFVFAAANGGGRIRAVAVRRSSQEGLAVLVRGDSPVQAFADLRGRRIATGRGSIGHYLVLAALRANGMTAEDVQIAFLLPADAKSALAGGSVDAWSVWEPYTSQAEVLDGARRVVSGEGLTPGLGFQAAAVSAIEANPEELSDFLRRMAAARRWANANLDAYAASWAALMGFPESVPLHWFHRTKETVAVPDAQVASDLQAVADTFAAAGLLRTPFDARSAMEPRFADAIRAGGKAA